MTVRVISEKPVVVRRHVCSECGYELEFNDIDLVCHVMDCDGDACEKKGMYLVCPRRKCRFRNWVEDHKRGQ